MGIGVDGSVWEKDVRLRRGVRGWAIARPSLPVRFWHILRLMSVTVFGRSLISPEYERVMICEKLIDWSRFWEGYGAIAWAIMRKNAETYQ